MKHRTFTYSQNVSKFEPAGAQKFAVFSIFCPAIDPDCSLTCIVTNGDGYGLWDYSEQDHTYSQIASPASYRIPQTPAGRRKALQLKLYRELRQSQHRGTLQPGEQDLLDRLASDPTIQACTKNDCL